MKVPTFITDMAVYALVVIICTLVAYEVMDTYHIDDGFCFGFIAGIISMGVARLINDVTSGWNDK